MDAPPLATPPPPPTPLQASSESLTAAQQARAIDQCISQLVARFDARLGGFGSAPKFPRPAEINVLLHQHARLVAAGEQEAAGGCGRAVGRRGVGWHELAGVG
jgi:uncharacterized protein YyaL (SSP411 family)